MAAAVAIQRHVVDGVLGAPGVGEVQGFIHPDRQHPGRGDHRVAAHIAKMLGAWHLPQLRHVRLAGAPQVQRQRRAHPGDHADLHPRQQHPGEGHQHGGEIRLGVAPGAPQRPQIHQGQHRHDDGRRQGGLGQVVKPGGEEQCGERDAGGGEHAGHGAAGTGVEINHRARKAAGDREAAAHPGRQIGGAQADQLGVAVDPLAPLGGQGLSHRHRLHEADQADQQRRQRQLAPHAGVERRQRQRRQAAGDGADHRHAPALQVAGGHRHGGADHRQHRPGLGEQIGQHGRQRRARQQPFQRTARPQQEEQGGGPHQQGGAVDAGGLAER